MLTSLLRVSLCVRLVSIAGVSLALFPGVQPLQAESAHVRVNQAGYETGAGPFRAYLMSRIPAAGTTFQVVNSSAVTMYSGRAGTLLGTWSHSKTVTYNVYALDFDVPGGDLYTISVENPAHAVSPRFAVDEPNVLYPGLLLNTLFFYETERDGADFVRNALRTAPGHLNDASAQVFRTPPLDTNDFIDNVPPTPPLVSAKLPSVDVSGGWWDAGDYEKYVETLSYTAALMQIGIRDFPNQMGAGAMPNPPIPPASISYAGTSSPGAPASSDFTGEARFGVNWLMKMWDDDTRTLYFQVDNTQDWDYYGYGNPSSTNCGGTYSTPYCLITEYDVWTLPQAADHYWQPGNPEACDPYTTFFICYRPVYLAAPAGSRISPNLAGRLAADFALCYQLNRITDPALAHQCLKNAEDIFDLADTSFPDPAPSVNSGTCHNCLLTIAPFDGYPENVWEDDMELGATELYFALQSALQSALESALQSGLPSVRQSALQSMPSREAGKAGLFSDLPHTDPMFYLRQAAAFASNYTRNIYDKGFSDTLNLYDVSGLAHFELYRALQLAGNPRGLPESQASIGKQLLRQLGDAITQASADAWGFGYQWSYGDTTSHGAGLAVMASEAYYLTNDEKYNTYSQRWLANILGANSWGSSFIVGDGTTFPNCIQHQVANLAGTLDGTSGGTPVLWGAAVEGPAGYATSGVVEGMILCPSNGVDTFAQFNGNDGTFNPSQVAVYRDNMQSYSTTEPAIDLTSTSFLMWSWRLAQQPSF